MYPHDWSCIIWSFTLFSNDVTFILSSRTIVDVLPQKQNQFFTSLNGFAVRISSEIYRKLSSDVMRMEQEDLDIRCLQLLRAVIHNEERKLPENWEENPTDNKK